MSLSDTHCTSSKRPFEGTQPASSSKRKVPSTPPLQSLHHLDYTVKHSDSDTSILIKDEGADSDKENADPHRWILRRSNRLNKSRSQYTLQTAPSTHSSRAPAEGRLVYRPFNNGPTSDVSNEEFRSTTLVDFKPDITRSLFNSCLDTPASLFYPSSPSQTIDPWSSAPYMNDVHPSVPSDPSEDDHQAAHPVNGSLQLVCAVREAKEASQAVRTVKEDCRATDTLEKDLQAADIVEDDDQATEDDDQVTEDDDQATEDDDQAARTADEDDQAGPTAEEKETFNTVNRLRHQVGYPVDDNRQAISTPSDVTQGAEPTSDVISPGTSVTCPTSAQPIVSDAPVANLGYRPPVIGPDQTQNNSFMPQTTEVMQVLERHLRSMGRISDRIEMDWRASRRQKSQDELYHYNRLSSLHQDISISLKSYIILYERYPAEKELEK